MKHIFGVALKTCLLFCLLSCNPKPADVNVRENEKPKKEKKVSTNKNPKDVQMMTKLEGIWQSNQEPAAMQFFEDGSYRRFIPGGQNEPEAVDEEHDNGNWTVESGELHLKSEGGKREKIILSWISDKLIYLGNIDEEYDPEVGSKEEFATEFGFSKISD